MPDCRFASIAVLLLAALAGCAAAPPAPAPAAPALPTSASVGGANIVAIAPPGQQCCPKQTLPQFLGIVGACNEIKTLCNNIRNRLGAIWPGLEAKPPVLSLTDPANLQSDNPAVQSAAEVKAAEDGAAQKAKAIAYLASIGCAGCYPGIEEALIAALDDCTELIRFETLKALRQQSMGPCKNCCRSACCSPKMREKMEKLAYELDAQGCYVEPSERVRRMARLALCNCQCVPLKPGQTPAGLPPEGPSPAEAAPPPPPAGATASILRALPATEQPLGSGVITAQPASRNTAQPAAGNIANPAGGAPARPVSYEEALLSYQPGGRQAEPAAALTAWEIWSARPQDFASRPDAVAALSMARMQLMTSQAGPLPPQLQMQTHGWTDPATIRSPAIARAVATTPVSGVSGVLEDHLGWHLVRPIARRPAPRPTPAAGNLAQHAATQLPSTATQLQQPAAAPVPPALTTVRLPPCDCH